MLRFSQRFYSTKELLCLGIRREGKNRWERRVPLVPEDVERLTKEFGARVLIQPSTKRIVPDQKYIEAGAIVQEDLSSANVIVGVKEVPLEQLLSEKTYLFFSHTHKGQPHNMKLLKSVLEKNIRLLDYELMTNENGKRLVLFSKFAGYAGMIDGFNGLAQRLLGLGYGTPFLSCGMSYMYRCLPDARLDVTRTGQVIMDDGLPRELGPMIFTFTGNGNVTKGALHVFKCLPHEWVSVKDLPALVRNKNFNNHKVYACMAQPEDYLVHKQGKPFQFDHYLKCPDEYESLFHDRVAPYSSMIINGVLWSEQYPRLMTIEQTKNLAKQNRLRLHSLADISCDIRGPFEFMSHATSIDQPFFMYDPLTGEEHCDYSRHGIQIMSIDNLPTEMPLEASQYFSSALLPQIIPLVKGQFDHPVLKRAAITQPDGQLVPKFKHLRKSIEVHASPAKVIKKQKVLLLGSGYVAGPVVDHFAQNQNTLVTIATNKASEAQYLAKGRQNVSIDKLDIRKEDYLKELISKHDVVISLVPATYHALVAQLCIDAKKDMVTASYISSEMQALDQRAKHAGITILNELGLDPGIDHMAALKAIHDIKKSGGQVTGFTSWCGGLPAPEYSNNPLGYKFSWSPRGVLLATQNAAKYRKDGKLVDIPGHQLLSSSKKVGLFPGFSFEGIPNRDSIKYIPQYGLAADIPTIFRGTLRYQGFCELMSAFSHLGLMATMERAEMANLKDMSWPMVMRQLLGIGKADSLEEAIQKKLSVKFSKETTQKTLDALTWFGLMNNSTPCRISEGALPTYLDAFCEVLQQRLTYTPGERDMVCLYHDIEYQKSNGQKAKKIISLVDFGQTNGYSAMAKTVGYPAALGAELILQGQLKGKGVIAPVMMEAFEPILKRLKDCGIECREEDISL